VHTEKALYLTTIGKCCRYLSDYKQPEREILADMPKQRAGSKVLKMNLSMKVKRQVISAM
jgi:hypothetical protein